MFLKPANSVTDSGIKKKFKMSSEKYHVQRNLENWKVKNLMYQNNTVIGWLPNFKKYVNTFFLFHNVPIL